MIDELTRIGDEVIITIPQENRECGYNPCPDGTKATILGFSEIHYGRLDNFGFKPGVYINRAWVNVQLPNGKEYFESSGRLELTNKDEYERRLSAFRKLQQEQPDNWRSKEFLRNLPETPFWEGDFVRTCDRSTVTDMYGEMLPNRDLDVFVFQIVRIDYRYLTEQTQVGTKYPAYNISSELGAGWYTSASEDDMVLIERGPVWKFFHNEPITFGNIKEEAQFFELLGHTEEIRNPVNGLYSWTQDEVLDAIRSGVAHGFSVSGGFFPGRPSIRAKRFKNEDLGRRVAQATLEGF
ncbi:MAG: hypothetical protein HGB03_03095 [Candidatus Yonathbacteria bacterium]|nr:hypothetical protein [Candidatus Yonathbacteria bacterium]NTW47380.1 hypothetical protein [Candidatus Yonathbacteria bacterium]